MEIIAFLCRASYYISLLGLKIPAGLLVRASRADRVLAFILVCWFPFLLLCHFVLLPRVESYESRVLLWHSLTALWVTLPLMVVGTVILSVVRGRQPCVFLLGALAGVACFHRFAVPALAASGLAGACLLQLLFAFFEDMPVAGWIWCLSHVLRLQRHIGKRQAETSSPFAKGGPKGDGALIVGNAPTLTEGLPLGAVIDSFDQVVRFNNYSVSKPKFTGSQVDFHFCNGRNFPTSKQVKAVCPLFYASLTHSVYLFMPHMEDAPEIFACLTSPKVDAWFVGEEEILSLRRKIGCRPWQVPTSGMVAIVAFLASRKEVSIHGFNFFQGKKIHYFEESATALITSWLERFVTHGPLREKAWVQVLEREGRVVILAEAAAAAHAAAAMAASGEAADGEAAEAEAESGVEKEKKLGDGVDELRRRTPGMLRTLLKDGLPSQFSL